jgi:hypothetical protein
VIRRVKQYEQQMGYQKHPIGMTMQFPVPEQSRVNDPLYASPAEWISPGFNDIVLGMRDSPWSRWYISPPANDGRKVIITDTDHYAPGMGDALWAWKSFVRGHNPILMDFGIIDVVHPLDPSLGVPSYESFEAGRCAMGDTLDFASRVGLVDMQPRDDLSSTGYVLANAGREYVVLQPDVGPFSVRPEPGTYSVEWFNVTERTSTSAAPVSVDGPDAHEFQPPFTPAVLYLKAGAP